MPIIEFAVPWICLYPPYCVLKLVEWLRNTMSVSTDWMYGGRWGLWHENIGGTINMGVNRKIKNMIFDSFCISGNCCCLYFNRGKNPNLMAGRRGTSENIWNIVLIHEGSRGIWSLCSSLNWSECYPNNATFEISNVFSSIFSWDREECSF